MVGRLACCPVSTRSRRGGEPAPKHDEQVTFTRGMRLGDLANREFLAAAKAVDPGDLRVTPQLLAVFAEDGRWIDYNLPRTSGVVPEYARAAAALDKRGALSEVVETQFGYHVIMLLERTPAKRVPEAERRAALRDEILMLRGKRMHAALLEDAKQRIGVEVSRKSDALLAQVKIGSAP